MPPNPSALWSSNTNTNQESENNINQVDTMNNSRVEDDVIGSLGKVLSSVNLAGEVDGSNHSSVNSGQGGQQSVGYGAPGSAVGSQTAGATWNGLSGSAGKNTSG